MNGDEKAQAALYTATENLERITLRTVTSLQQTAVKEIKASIAANDGQFTRQDLLALTDKALVSIKAQLTDATKEALSTAYSDLDSYIRDLIQTTVYELKARASEALPGLLVESQDATTAEFVEASDETDA